MWRSGKPWTVYYLMLTSQSAVPSQGVYVQLVLRCLPPHDEAYWMMGLWGRSVGNLRFRRVALVCFKAYKELSWMANDSWLTIIVISLLSISCFNRASFFGGGGVVGRRMAFESVSGLWGVVMSTWPLLPLAGGRSCSFLPQLLCSRFLFSYSPFPYFNFLCFYSPSSFLQTLSIRLRFAGHNAWPYAFIEEWR